MRNPYHRDYLALSVLILAISMHVILFDQIPLQYDELIMYELVSKKTYLQLINHLFFSEFQLPLSYLLIKSIGLVAGFNSYIIRLPSLLSTFVSCYFFYKTSRFDLSKSDSMKASAVFLLSYPVLIFSSSIRPYSLLLLFSVISLYLLRLFLVDPRREKIFKLFLISLIPLCLTHFSGVGLGGYLLVYGMMNLKKKISSYLKLISIVPLIALLAFFYIRQGDFSLTGRMVDFFTMYGRFFYSLSFLTSGAAYTFFIVLGLITYVFKKEKIKIHELYLKLVIYTIAAAGGMLFLIHTYFQPRHLIFLTPLVAIFSMILINMLSSERVIRNWAYLLIIIVLGHKALYKEKIYLIPYEIDTVKISNKLKEMSENDKAVPIISCGNCLSYYYNSSNMDCYVGNIKDRKMESSHSQLIYIEYDFVKKHCGVHLLSEKYLVGEKFSYIGGTVYRLIKI